MLVENLHQNNSDRIKTLDLISRLAEEQQVPPYIIFSDATLRDMVGKQPGNEDEFLDVSGVGPQKLEHYGAMFLKAINDFVVENGTDS